MGSLLAQITNRLSVPLIVKALSRLTQTDTRFYLGGLRRNL